MNDAKLLTITDLSRELRVKRHVLKYALEESDIQPIQRAGIVRLWSREQIPLIQSQLDHTKREAVGA